jgi:lipopolysaccharide export system permease protein
LALTLPMAVLVSTLFAFTRLASENEITALKASGVGMNRILVPVLIAAAGVTLFMLFFNDQILPRTNHRLSALMTDIAQTKPTFALREQVINEVTPGKLYLRANHIEESRLMREVTIYDMSDAARRRTIVADSGTIGLEPNKTDLLMTLYTGVMMDVPTASPDQLQRLFFNTDLIRVRGVANQFQKSATGDSRSPREQSICQMQGEVDRVTKEYEEARGNFLQSMEAAKTYKIKLDPSIYKIKAKPAPKYSLGGAYCALLKQLHVPELQAQDIKAPTPAKPLTPHQRSLQQQMMQQRMQQMQRMKVIQPGVTPRFPPGMPQPIIGPDGVPHYPPPAYMTPSVIESARIRLEESKSEINRVDVEIHKKFALAVACFVFVMLGAPIALRFPRGGVGLTIGASLLVFAIYYIGLIAGASLGSHGIVPPWIAMWATNVIFGLIGLALISRMGKEASTARGGDTGEIIDTVKRWFKGRLRVVGFLRERRANA